MRKFAILFALLWSTISTASTQHDECPLPPDPEFRCVQKCEQRWSSGECRTYASDYCDFDASCVPFCKERWSNGECRVYYPDYCGKKVRCISQCRERWSNGECRTYGEDICISDRTKRK